MNEKLVKFRLIRVQEHDAVIEMCVLNDATHCFTRRFRMDEGSSVSLSFNASFPGDKVDTITDEVRSVIRRARRHAAL